MNYYLMAPVIATFVILTMAQNREKAYYIQPGMQGIGQVLYTLCDEDESTCAVACMTAKICTSYNMLFMSDGKQCQLLAAVHGRTTNVNSVLYGMNYCYLFVTSFMHIILIR